MSVVWFLLLALLFVFTSIRYSHKYRLYSKIPGPGGIKLLRCFLQILESNPKTLWLFSRELQRSYYPISCLWVFNQAAIYVSHPDDLELLLSSQKTIEKGYPYVRLHPWLKTGLLTSTGSKWQQRRKILTPAFHFGILKKYIKVTYQQRKNMIESLKKKGSETVINALPFFKRYTIFMVCESILGIKLDKMQIHEIMQFEQSINDMGNVAVYRSFRPYLIDCIFPYVSKMGEIQTRAIKILNDFTSKLIQLHKEEYLGNDDNEFLDEYNESNEFIYHDSKLGTKKNLDMLKLLMLAEKKGLIDKDGIQEEVDNFVFAGHDTLSSALTFITMLLAENKEAQDRARAEVTAILDAANGKTEVGEIQQFYYLERCIKESLRLFPPAPQLARYIREDLQLKHALLPGGTTIFIQFWETHRDPNFWPEPEKFDPDRFLPENSKNRHPFSYVPFSAGPRNCIGQKFAMMQLKSIMASILYNFYLEPIDHTAELPLAPNFVMIPANPVHVKFIEIIK